MIDNLEQLKTFYYVAQMGGVTKAAKELLVSQPAVSQSIRQLEDRLGVELFSRTSKGTMLTKEGEILFSHVKRGYEEMEQGIDHLSRMKNLETGEIRIGASDMTLKYYLLPFLEQFHEKHPGIKVMVTNGPTPETLKFLHSGKIDFGVVSTPFIPDPELETIKVREIEDVFVAGRRFLPYKNRMLSFQDLESLPIISLEQNTSTRKYIDQIMEENGVKFNPEFELANSDMIVQFALRSLGIGCVVEDFAKEYIESGMLFPLRFNAIIPKRAFCIARNKNIPLSSAAKSLLSLLKYGR